MSELFSLEAEERVLGYLLNPHISAEDKQQVMQLVDSEHFMDEKYQSIFNHIKSSDVFNKIVLWDKIQKSKLRPRLRMLER